MGIKQRIEWLDVAKGMAIILVVLGHSALPTYANRFIFAFHMPFFFFASGYSSNFKRDGFGVYVVRKANVLLLPFVVYSLINLALQPYVSDFTYIEYWSRFMKEGWQGVPLWFVPVLFFSLILAKLFNMLATPWQQILMFIILPTISVTFKIFEVSIPWNLAVVPYATFLVLIGNFAGRFNPTLQDSMIERCKLYLMICCVAVTCFISFFWKLDMCWNSILPFIPLLIGAITGSIFLSLLAMLIVLRSTMLKKILEAVGKETYLILALAEITIVYLNYFFTINSLIKYILLVVLLYLMWLVKKYVLIIKNIHSHEKL